MRLLFSCDWIIVSCDWIIVAVTLVFLQYPTG